jgi:ABC-type nitrate/sulfonate/bicarbonate transport system substrate-binding protein
VAIICAAAIAVAAAVITAFLTTTGSSPPRRPTAAQAARQRASQTDRALGITRTQPATPVRTPQLRLGILATPADTTGLAAIQLGYIAAKLSPSGTHLTTTAYTSADAEATALADGAIDAAYITPAAATTAWQHPGHQVRIIAGADQTADGAPAVVLAVRNSYLTNHPARITDLLQGHIQATTLLTSSPALALPAARDELQQLTHHQITKTTSAAFGRYRATNSPGTPDTSGSSELLDLALVNTLLRASGLAPA